MSTPLEETEGQQLPEDVPDGTFGRAQLRLPEHFTPCTPEEQARHLAALGEALSGLAIGDIIRRHTRPGAAHAHQ